MHQLKELKASAPGKLILCGEHSVTYGKKALASAIDLRTHLTAHRKDDDDDDDENNSNVFELNLPNINRTIRLTSNDFSTIKPPDNRIISRDEALSQLLEKFKEDDKQLVAVKFMIMTVPDLTWSHLERLRVEIRSDIPLASGLGSSASFSVCLSALFILLTKPDADLDLDAVNSYAFALEHIFHGRPSGIDNSVACYGNYVVFERGSIVDKFSSARRMPPILVVNSCVAKQTSEQVSKVRQLHSRHSNIVDSLMNTINEIVGEFVHILKSENDVTTTTTTANGAVNDLITLNHGILHSIQVDRLELATIVGLAAKYGFHAKITGSGGGGCCFVMLSDEDEDENRRQMLVDELGKFHFLSFPTKLGCKGITIENIEF